MVTTHQVTKGKEAINHMVHILKTINISTTEVTRERCAVTPMVATELHLYSHIYMGHQVLKIHLTASPENPWTMWICAVSFALTDSNIYHLLLSWLGSHMKNLDKLPILFSTSFSVGVMILPYLTAHLLDTFGYLAYPGVLLGCSMVCAMTFTFLYFLVWCKYDMVDDNQEITPLLQSHAHI